MIINLIKSYLIHPWDYSVKFRGVMEAFGLKHLGHHWSLLNPVKDDCSDVRQLYLTVAT